MFHGILYIVKGIQMFDRYAFWKNPGFSNEPQYIKDMCVPEFYLGLGEITDLVVETLSKYLGFEDSILELGCGTGRNLAGLKSAGFKNLSGIEINMDAIKLGVRSFDLDGVKIKCSTVEEAEFVRSDCIFTQGLLQHLPPESDLIHWVMSKKARKIIMVIENESPVGVRSWGRDYKDIFEGLGWKEVESLSNTGLYGHAPTTTMRVFK